MADLNAFLEHTVEGYLLGDLKALQKLGPLTGDLGACNYPLLATAFSGIELFGALLSKTDFERRAGGAYFEAYWRDHLYTSKPQSEVGKALYQLARHGLKHLFMMKGPISVGKNGLHLQREANGTVVIDAVRFATDLERSYYKAVKQQAGKDMADRLDQIIKAYQEQWSQYEGAFKALPYALPKPNMDLSLPVVTGSAVQAPAPSGSAMAVAHHTDAFLGATGADGYHVDNLKK
jgi:hypothetical protein